MGILMIRFIFLFLGVSVGLLLTKGTFSLAISIGIGFLLGVALISLAWLMERRVVRMPMRIIAGAVVGMLAGFLIGRLVIQVFPFLPYTPQQMVHIRILSQLFFGYLGLIYGIRRGESFDLISFRKMLVGAPRAESQKILDTSVIIDGRIADILVTGFIEGTLLIPQFVLKELQHIADSSDVLKRNRGRRGLDILQQIQKKIDIDVEIIETDFSKIREVDAKLIELAKRIGGKIITNDYNLNKVAELHGIPVLNINELANSLKPVVLPGEVMNVHVIKEGKEYGQGVAYLDDGTMVVVDNASRVIGQTIDVTVTSVLQTTAGRMIFGKLKNNDGAKQ